ncbi:MAG: ATP synthase F1 subunit epsilon [Armatimonadetes bacterium]|nr:ATP synthase F1 subunit epsilon [Armatimonadota bacterium]
MPQRTYLLEIVTPERLVFSGDVTSITAPGELGYFSVWANHAPLLAALRSGVLTFREAQGEEKKLAVGGGFFEVASNHAILLADSAEFPEEIDVEKERENLRLARHQASHSRSEQVDPETARVEAERSAARLKLVEPS